MALIIENGTVVADANSYLTEAEANQILAGFGYTLEPTTAEVDLRTAAQYLETFRKRYQGDKVDPANQALQWPRFGVCIDGYLNPADNIPAELKTAQALGAYYESQGMALNVVSNGQTKTAESIDGVGSFSYGDNGDDSAQMKFNQMASYINVLLKPFGVFRA